MVRETRHLWVGNLPDNIREDRIREHFKRYGRVQNVKLLGRAESASAGVGATGASGVCATVAFMDIKSASKAHNAEHVLDERTLTTEYYEPAAIPPAAGAPSAGSSPAGSGYSGSSSSVNSAPAPSSASRYHLSGGEESSGPAATCPIAASAAAPATWRGTNDSATEYCRRGNTPAAYGRYQRNNSTAPYSTPPSNLERTTPHHRWYASSGGGTGGGAGGESTPSTPGGGTESGRRRRRSGSASSRSDSSSAEPSDTSRASTPAALPPLAAHHNNHRVASALSHQWTSTASGRPLSICVRNLPTRSTDSSLKDGLYHEYKKHGKVVWVKVVGQNADRYAVVRFKKPSDVEKALEVSQDKLFFGCKISVAPHQSCDDDADSTKPYETDIDEYHPKATRTLFIGNLEKDVTQQQLRDKFKHFGRIIEIDIKKGSGGGAGYAFCQYASISSVVEAIRAMDGEYVGGSRVKLGFGKPVATACVWVDGLTEHTEKQVLGAVSRCGAATSVCVDRAAGAALVHFEQACAAGAAVRELRRVAAAASAAEPDHPRLCVDYASRECQDAFYEQLEKHGGSAALAGSERLSGDLSTRYVPSTRHDPIRFEAAGSRSRASSYGRSSSRTPRYAALEHYDPVDYAADRRYRAYDDAGASPPLDDLPFDDRLQSVVVSPHRARRHRRDSSPDDRKHSKERRRSAGGGPRRSRSGSGGRERHAARRKHRRRRDGSGSRAGTPLRDEGEAPPVEPRRPPRDRPALPMCLPLPKFAAQLLRAPPPAPRAPPAPAPAHAPDSPPRPPSVSSSSGGSAPHSPSLEERIRSLDEKYEKWSGSRALADAPDRARLRHRLLEVDINEVKPSEVVRSLLAKRSVFDEDSERLECVVRAPSPSDRGTRLPPPTRYSLPAPPPSDPRLNRPERPSTLERLAKINESDYGERRPRPRTPSSDRSQPESCGRRSPSTLADADADAESRSRDSATGTCDAESKSSFETDDKDMELGIKRERANSSASDSLLKESSGVLVSSHMLQKESTKANEETSERMQPYPFEQGSAREVLDMILRKVEHGQLESKLDMSCKVLNENKLDIFNQGEHRTSVNSEMDVLKCDRSIRSESNKLSFHQTFTSKETLDFEIELQNHINSSILLENKESELCDPEIIKCGEKNEKDRYNSNLSEGNQPTKTEKENVKIEKSLEMDTAPLEKKITETESIAENRNKIDRDKIKQSNKERPIKEKQDNDKDRLKSVKNDKTLEKNERDKKLKEESVLERNHLDKIKVEKDGEKINKDKTETEKLKHEEKHRHDHHKKDKSEKGKKESEIDTTHKSKKEDRHKSDKPKRDIDIKREIKKESDPVKSRKSSRDESARDISRKDSTDSSTSRTSHESSKSKDLDNHDVKEEMKPRVKLTDLFFKLEMDKETQNIKDVKCDSTMKLKTEIKEEKPSAPGMCKTHDGTSDTNVKLKAEIIDKHRHHSLDSPVVESKRKERLNSCSSLPSNIGHKRRISSHDSFDSVCEEAKKNKNDSKLPERRDSKDSRSGDRHKSTKFNKGHFAKIIENKSKEEKKNQVKPLEEAFVESKENSEIKTASAKGVKKSPKETSSENLPNETREETHNNLDFLALFELRSSEEDERQKALRKEMKEKKRIQQLQQIQELQMQQDAMQQGELMSKLKDDKKQKSDDKKKEVAREKRFSTDRKSREEKNDNGKKKSRKPAHSSDTSDSDEPKKHSIFDIVDDGPTYISMYDKVKARSCKNMQKQEEEKRQEKIKAKFSQLKQSRAKREEKKRSSWDEDSDSEHDVRRKPQKSSLDNSSDDGSSITNNKKSDKMISSNIEYYENRADNYYSNPNDGDSTNKLARKNSRTRIISDSSDDDTSKSKSPNYINDAKNLNVSDCELRTMNNIGNCKDYSENHIKKTSILQLFGKSDSDDNRLKSNSFNENNYKLPNFKTMSNDMSSESESITSARNSVELRRKHKKKPKKHKSTYSDDENKTIQSDSGVGDAENRYKFTEKQHRHSKKEKRREKVRESVDTDESRDDKVKGKREKRTPDNTISEYGSDVFTNNIKRDGKMEDIFGPLSDESDKDTVRENIPSHDFDSIKDRLINNSDPKLRDRDDCKRKKEKRRKEKRWLREDDNSLDMDAVSKAIEARLFAEPLTDEDNRIRIETLDENMKQDNNEHKILDENLLNELAKLNNKHDKLRRDNREKKKKRKRNKEDRQNRKDHHSYYHSESYEKSDSEMTDRSTLDTITNTMLLDIPLPNDSVVYAEKLDEVKTLAESPSLPRLTESPPILVDSVQDITRNSAIGISKNNSIDETNNVFLDNKDIEIEQIPMPPPLVEDVIVHDISDVPLPAEPAPVLPNEAKSDNLISTLNSMSSDSDLSEDAVRSISMIETDNEKVVEVNIKNDKPLEKVDIPSPKLDKKMEEKPRAIISQEETEDAVAALLGESFGEKIDTFSSYEEPECTSPDQNAIESTTLTTENIPEEDAEEMRQAVQNLNACEMELKPDTPVSDNDLLLIDTDTEETDEPTQEVTDKVTAVNANKIASSSSTTEIKKPSVPGEVSHSKSVEALHNLSSPLPPIKPIISETEIKNKDTEVKDVKIQLARRDNIQIITSTATPVITSWTLTNKKMLEPHVINIPPNNLSNKDKNENKHTHLTTNIVQIKNSQTQNVQINNIVKPVLAPTRVSAPYQVISQMVRPQASNMHPPTIKIPEPHILYQKQQGIVISPRMTNETRLQSPKSSPQGDNLTSSRLPNVAILSTSPQNLNPSGMMSPNSIHQRSPGQVTVVRMQQPPLSPIQTIHVPHGARTMVSPNRPNSVLMQTQGSPIHFNRLPCTPVLTPISKQINVGTVLQQNKSIGVTSPLLSQQKLGPGEIRKNVTENKNENAKIILSPNNLQHNNSQAQVIAQNRLISMQNAVHINNINSPLHINNKVVINKMNTGNDKKEHQKVPEHAGQPFMSPIIHVAGVNHSNPSIIQSGTKSVMCNIQEVNTINRGQGSNVIHTLNSQRLLTPVSIGNIRQLDMNKVNPTVLAMGAIRASTVLTKIETSNITTSATMSNATNVTPILIKSGAPIGTIRINTKIEKDFQNHNLSTLQNESKPDDRCDKESLTNENKPVPKTIHPIETNLSTKCETDFEELLKDNTNKIIVTKDPEKKLEVNVGKNTTLVTSITQIHDRQFAGDFLVKEKDPPECDKTSSENVCPKNNDEQKEESNKINISKEITYSEGSFSKESSMPVSIKTPQKENTVLTSNILENINTETKPAKVECLLNKMYDNVSTDREDTVFDFGNIKNEEKVKQDKEKLENQIKTDENEMESWSAKDLNIESVIKKVDSLCNDVTDTSSHENNIIEKTDDVNSAMDLEIERVNRPVIGSAHGDNENVDQETTIKHSNIAFANVSTPKRGGRSMRGKKTEKMQDRVQTRQIAKTPRGASGAKRGRGRAKVDKKTKNLVNSNMNTPLPGDVYDFHEDSGDEGSAGKTEPRPRLILTIKSPLSGQVGVTATSTLSISQKDQNKLEERRPSKEDKVEEFVTPSPNTRKSRRLQEKDVHRGSADDSGDDAVGKARPAKRRPARQAGGKAPVTLEKALADTRKSPRGTKRTRVPSDTSADSGDGDGRRDEAAREPKLPRLEGALAAPEGAEISPAPRPVPPSNTAPAASTVASIAPCATSCTQTAPGTSSATTHVITSHTTLPAQQHSNVPNVAPASAPAPSPISAPSPAPTLTPTAHVPTHIPTHVPAHAAMHAPVLTPAPAPVPPTATAPVALPSTVPTPITKPPKKMISEISAKLAGAFEAALQHRGPARDPATGEAAATMPVGATEAAEARVQSPALPHRASAAARPCEGEPARARALSAGGCAAASLPRGAQHHHHHPAHHYQGVGSRITSVPSVSPQGPMALSADSIRSPPPAHQQMSPIPSGEGMYPHFSQQHYQMYQQHFRATQQEARATPSPFTRSLEAEGSEAPAPPLELRRPPSARVPRPAHSPSPADRHIMYAVGCGRSPPPAHGVSRVPGALPPGAPPGPPHASQVPREADSLQMLLRRYPVMWQGLLALKNDSAAVQMHFVGGNPGVASDTLARPPDLATPLLRIAQRMRLEPAQLDQVHRKMKLENEHCILLALPCGRDHMDVLQQSTNLTAGFITYLQRKCAAGIVNIAPPGHQQAMFTVHVFPSCEFANENLTRIAPDLMHRVADIAHLLIVIATA